MMQGGEAKRDPAFYVLANLQGEISGKVAEAIKGITSVRDDLLGSHPMGKSEEISAQQSFGGTVGELIRVSRGTLEDVHIILGVIAEMRADIPRTDSPAAEKVNPVR
jgi:hypothetical protein